MFCWFLIVSNQISGSKINTKDKKVLREEYEFLFSAQSVENCQNPVHFIQQSAPRKCNIKP